MVTIDQIRPIFQEIFDDPALAVADQTAPQDIPDWDSVAQVKLVLTIEQSFGVRFTTEEVASFHSAGDFVAALNRRQGAAS